MANGVAQAYSLCFRTQAGKIVLQDLAQRFGPNFPSYESCGTMDGISRVANAIHADGNKEVLLHIQGMIAEYENQSIEGVDADG